MNGAVMATRMEAAVRSLNAYRRSTGTAAPEFEFVSALLRDARPEDGPTVPSAPPATTSAFPQPSPQPVVQAPILAGTQEISPRPTTPGKILTKGVRVTVGGAVQRGGSPEMPMAASSATPISQRSRSPFPEAATMLGQYLDVFL